MKIDENYYKMWLNNDDDDYIYSGDNYYYRYYYYTSKLQRDNPSDLHLECKGLPEKQLLFVENLEDFPADPCLTTS